MSNVILINEGDSISVNQLNDNQRNIIFDNLSENEDYFYIHNSKIYFRPYIVGELRLNELKFVISM